MMKTILFLVCALIELTTAHFGTDADHGANELNHHCFQNENCQCYNKNTPTLNAAHHCQPLNDVCECAAGSMRLAGTCVPESTALDTQTTVNVVVDAAGQDASSVGSAAQSSALSTAPQSGATVSNARALEGSTYVSYDLTARAGDLDNIISNTERNGVNIISNQVGCQGTCTRDNAKESIMIRGKCTAVSCEDKYEIRSTEALGTYCHKDGDDDDDDDNWLIWWKEMLLWFAGALLCSCCLGLIFGMMKKKKSSPAVARGEDDGEYIVSPEPEGTYTANDPFEASYDGTTHAPYDSATDIHGSASTIPGQQGPNYSSDNIYDPDGAHHLDQPPLRNNHTTV